MDGGEDTHTFCFARFNDSEGGAGCYLYPCGAAMWLQIVISFVATGDHILMSEPPMSQHKDFCNVILQNRSIHYLL